MRISDLNPHIRYANIHRAHTNANKFSICYDCRFFYIENAVGSVSANNVKYNFSNGDLLYFPPKTKYRFSFKSCEKFKIIVLDFDLVNEFSHLTSSLGTATEKDFQLSLVPDYELPEELNSPIVKPMPQLKTALSQCADNFLKKTAFYREHSSALLKICLIDLVRQNTMTNSHSALCEEVLSYIHENYATASLTNTDIAEKFNYHPYHLSRIIKQETGKTLHQYLTYYRLRIAKNLLITTQYDIEEISWRSGFCSSAYFIKTFRLSTGMTPKKYRNMQFHTEL